MRGPSPSRAANWLQSIAGGPLSAFWRYGLAVVAVAAGFATRLGLEAWVGRGLPTFMTFYPAVMLAALLGGIGPGLLATALTALLAAIWIIPPIGQLGIASPVDRVAEALFCGMGVFMTAVAELHRRNRAKAAAFDRQAALRASEKKLRLQAAALEAAANGIALIDARGTIQWVNDAFTRLTGYSAAEAVGQSPRVLKSGQHPLAFYKAMWDTVLAGRVWQGEVVNRRKDGSLYVEEMTITPVSDAQGTLSHFVAIKQDITERKQAEAVLARDKEELERLVTERTARLQELVGELEHFSYTITHDMRAPLRAMRQFSELMRESCARCQHQEGTEFLRKIMTASSRMDRLITDALHYARVVRDELPLGEVDTGALVRGMLETYPEFQPSRAHIAVEGKLPVVLGNEAGLTQVFSNLLGNAVKFVKPGQKPEIRIRAEPQGGDGLMDKGIAGTQSASATASPQPSLNSPRHSEATAGPTIQPSSAPPRWVRIWVEDQGIGIAQSMLPRVFDMFSRGNNQFEGTGIGLALVRKVTQRMGGRVGVESEAGKGSRFWVELRGTEAGRG
jgi:PAS domain S-box-containing protein